MSEGMQRDKEKKVAYGNLIEDGIYDCGGSFIAVIYTSLNGLLA